MSGSYPSSVAVPRKDQPRRRLGGRQPLNGTGVTSWMVPSSRPAACSERIAVSRPEPGHLKYTSTFFRPFSCARSAVDYSAICEAYGVDLLAPVTLHTM